MVKEGYTQMTEETMQDYLRADGGVQSEAERDAEALAKAPDGQNEDMAKEAEEVNEDPAKEAEESAEDPAKEAERLEKERKRKEAIQRAKSFLYENRDLLILSGQLALVVLVCAVGIKNDLMPDGCCKKKKKKRKK